MHPRSAVTALLLAGVAGTGCGVLAPVEEGPSGDDVVAVDEALLHTVARDVAELPGVTCVDAFLSSAGLPETVPGDPKVLVEVEELPAGRRDALARDVAGRVWRSGPLGLVTLQVTLTAPDGSSDLGRLLTGDQGAVPAAALEDALGPRPARSRPASPPADPGNPGC